MITTLAYLNSFLSQVEVSVLDVNDNPPTFPAGAYAYNVPENSPSGSQVATIVATDADIGVNSEITYSLSGTQDVFTINATTGVISLSSTLNRELVMNYTLNVTATDGGTNQLSSFQLVTLFVVDANDNPPIFSAPYYNASMPEVG